MSVFCVCVVVRGLCVSPGTALLIVIPLVTILGFIVIVVSVIAVVCYTRLMFSQLTIC